MELSYENENGKNNGDHANVITNVEDLIAADNVSDNGIAKSAQSGGANGTQKSAMDLSMNSANSMDQDGADQKISGKTKDRINSHLMIVNKKSKRPGKENFYGNHVNNFLNKKKEDEITIQPEIFCK